MNKEKKLQVERAREYILHGSSISQSLKILYLQADAAMLQLMRAKNRIDSVFRGAGVTTKESPELGALKNYYTAIKQAVYFFDEFISKSIVNATWGVNEGKNRARSYDSWSADANALAKMIMLFCDRSCRDGEQMDRIFETLESMESHGLFTQEDFDYFTPKYPDEV